MTLVLNVDFDELF